jgi:cytochrome P450
MTSAPPVCDIDLYSDESIADPYPQYRALREQGAAVWLSTHSLYAFPRYEEVSAALRNHKRFSSAQGVSVSNRVNAVASGTLISSDPPAHDQLRKLMAAPLTPAAVATLREQFQAAALELVDHLLELGNFDAVVDLARVLPVSIVSRLVGLPEEGRENMLLWAGASFDLVGPDNQRAELAWPHALEMREYAANVARRGAVTRGGWADRLLDLADEGHVPHERLPFLFRDFMAPSLDTTIFATASLMYLLGTNPDQWRLLVENPSLVKNAVNEAVRLESPIRGFTRVSTEDCRIEDVALPAGSRVLILYASANRDERKWDNPERFDIRRRVVDHVGFGLGVHSCAGMHLAKLEIESILNAMITRVRSISVGAPVWALNNTLRGLASLPMTFE